MELFHLRLHELDGGGQLLQSTSFFWLVSQFHSFHIFHVSNVFSPPQLAILAAMEVRRKANSSTLSCETLRQAMQPRQQ
eukprot:2685451-Amphidinium_carterae.1